MKKRLLTFYGIVPPLFGIGIAAVLQWGAQLQATVTALPAVAEIAGKTAKMPLHGLHNPFSTLLLQIIVIIGAAKLLGYLFQKLKQPAVIGETVAGILLGPSLLGMLSPAFESLLFPHASLGTLQSLSQVGIVLFMFFVGIELDLSTLRQRAAAAALVSHASIVVPFFLGAALSLLLYAQLASNGISFTAFALFMGTAMSVTAFPVLARIIEERELTRTPLGTLALACAAIDDVTAWCILAVVVAIARAQGLQSALWVIAGALVFIGAMLFLVKPRIATLVNIEATNETRSRSLIIAVLLLVFSAALITESIGIHAIFGAFLVGVIMPPQAPLCRLLKARVETFGSLFLLPLFFAFTGSRTQIGLLGDGNSWWLCAAIIAVAVLGKLGGSLSAARWAGLSWRQAAALGALMNTRGLMELIVLNIGYDLGILSPRIFAMMVLMALVTTLMTGPLLDLFEYLDKRRAIGTLDRGQTQSA